MGQTDLGVVKAIFKGPHDSNITYEELNMVTSGEKTYSANKNVPGGIDISNQEYWTNLSGTGMTEGQFQGWAKTPISDQNKMITEFEEATIESNIAAVNTKTNNNTTEIGKKISKDSYASSTTGGTVKARVSGTTAYFTINGQNA